ncbi:hypothetical protein ACMDCT_03050 [Halomonadaceae bacterium KBTZ08]
MTAPDLPLIIWALPLFTALVGWATNRLAVWMLFHPVEPVGKPPLLGWQGVVPRRSEAMAHECIDRTLAHSGDLTGLYQRLDPALITGEVVSRIMPYLEEYVDDVMYEHHPVLWDNLPRRLKQRIYRYVEHNLPDRVDAMVADFGEELGDLVDLKALMSEELQHHPEFMNTLLQEAGESTFRFVIRSGGVIGLLLGVGLTLGGTIWPSQWLLVGGGFIVGLLTNWIALTLIFRPRESKRLGPFRVQGLLMRQQPEVSRIWGQRVAHELLTCEKVAHAIVHGEKASRTRAIIQKHLRPLLDQSTVMRLSTQMAVGASGYTELKKSMNDRALIASEEVFRDDAFNQDRARVVAEVIEERIAGLSPEAFQSILRPVFAAEEGRLMLAGGLCGLIAALVPVVLSSL